MKRSKLVTLFAMVAAMVFASAAAAYAAPGGTVYGQATMQPTISIVVGGAGSDSGMPLVYEGPKDQWAMNFNGPLTITNDGDTAAQLSLGFGSDPTDGVTTWSLGSYSDATHCMWNLDAMSPPFMSITQVPASGEPPVSFGPDPLMPGDTAFFDSHFFFPATYDGSPHTMTALIIAGS
ncbi:MAG: hypothetical protein CVT67_02755 [Actinobacteria bacterium HGW-Actinobacteria-7]|nr:MAG: hypothetical protein CVT67_02755 [Actinobacteria bacterium HGW-Actinobacteria-7]